MSLATKLGTLVGTTTAYAVHYMRQGATPLGLACLVYTHRTEIQTSVQKFVAKHALNKNIPNAVEDNLLECLEYID